MKKIFLFLADGFEEIEAISTVDVLRRGGIHVVTVSISKNMEVKGAHNVPVIADILLSEIAENDADCLVFPGGMPGAKNLSENKLLMSMLQRHFDKKGWIAAICAAPALVLGGLKTDRTLRLTCYPGFEEYLPNAEVLPQGVVIDGNVITAKGPAFSAAFGLSVVEHLLGSDVAKEVSAGMLVTE